jgi:hypothetical protein
MSITVTLTSAACTSCGAAVKGGLLTNVQKAFVAAGGACACGGSTFDVALLKKLVGSEEATMGDQLPYAAFGMRVESIEHTWEHTYEFGEVEGRELLDLLQGRPDAAVEWISARVKQVAKANLQPGQALCKECDEIFVVQKLGHTAEGFCSPICRKKYFVKRGAAPPDSPKTPVAPAKPVPCSKCGKPVKPRPGARCLYCGTAV